MRSDTRQGPGWTLRAQGSQNPSETQNAPEQSTGLSSCPWQAGFWVCRHLIFSGSWEALWKENQAPSDGPNGLIVALGAAETPFDQRVLAGEDRGNWQTPKAVHPRQLAWHRPHVVSRPQELSSQETQRLLPPEQLSWVTPKVGPPWPSLS